MNQSQMKYARERAEAAFAAKKKAITSRFTIAGVTFDSDAMLAAIRAGAATLKDDAGRKGRWAYVRDFFSFDGEVEAYTDQAAIDAATTEAKAAFDRLMDELILGDNAEALRLLRDFEAV